MKHKLEEVWRPINGFEDYHISNYGRVKSMKVYKGGLREIILKPILTDYPHVSLWKNNKVSIKKLHRLVAENFIPNPLGKLEVNHIDANKHNPYIENLEWVTNKENKYHAMKSGLLPRGEAHVKHKLSYTDIIYIHENRHLAQQKLAGLFNVTQSLIGRLLKDKERINYAYSKA